ncbi:MAG: hypothetical protein K9H61_13385 [Bacteroidia bacterium]|nr:hypothetical protein [Bacteroidia bacterium]MCF8427078.1 hypothetical protein [Bacteroidia bacterium]MCF8447976.1 hypothetical protein [Bacteroidia bacterium]
MVKSLYLTFFTLLLLFSNRVFSQTDSTKSEIQKEALQMRETLNKYLSNQLLTNEGTGNSNVKATLVDSISTLISKQHMELELLKTSLKDIEKAMDEIRQKQQALESSDILVSGVKSLGTNSLELFFSFDGAKLTEQQILTLNRFIGNQKISQIELTGYSDWVGSERYNKKLGKRRCNSVKQSIFRKGIKVVFAEPIVLAENSFSDASFCRKVLVILK